MTAVIVMVLCITVQKYHFVACIFMQGPKKPVKIIRFRTKDRKGELAEYEAGGITITHNSVITLIPD